MAIILDGGVAIPRTGQFHICPVSMTRSQYER